MDLKRSREWKRGCGRARRGGASLSTVAGLVLCLAAACAFGQSAAQRTALARLGLGTGPRPQNAQPGGVEATTVPLLMPEQLAFDSAGNLYIADAGDNLIREVSVTGVISTAAGNGAEGFSGDGGPAASAQLDTPYGVAVDASGNLYIADTGNQRIREVSGGTISTLAGTGVAGFNGDGSSPAAAQLANPTALAIDGHGNLYIADTGNQRIRKIAGTTITTVAGTGQEGFSGDGAGASAANLDEPSGIALDAAGNLYIGDTKNQRVRMVSAATGNISTVAGSGAKGFTGDGAALSTALASPSGLAVDASGNVYFADADNDRMREISGGNVTTLAGLGVQGYSGDTGAATGAQLNTPRAVVVGSSVILIADTDNNVIRAISAGIINSSGGVPTSGTESLVIGSALTAVYGTGTLTATFSNHGATATGQVSFYDQQAGGAVLIDQSTLAGNVAGIGIATLAAGTHSIVATYAGDASNNPITSGVYIFVITPAPLTAVANGVSLLYGQAIPTLTGTLTGVLARDAGNVTAVYSTTATSTSAPGTYPIDVSLTGVAAGNYNVTPGAGSGSVTIGQSPTATALTASNLAPILGTGLTLTATVTSTSGATTAGTVDFYNGTQKVNSAAVAVSGGVATLTLSTLPVGTQSLTAVYSGNIDFAGSTSAVLSLTEISPDFTISATPSAQSVDYTLSLTPVNPTFVYPVTLTASGLPVGVNATFTPSTVATGSAATSVKLTLTASALARLDRRIQPFGRWPAAPVLALWLPLAFWRRARNTASRLSGAGALLLALLALGIAAFLTGCGGGGFFSHRTESATVTVTAVCGPDTHTTSVTLTVQ
jgi:sugar lactone lactonase YvrE